jgi:hypothetical protein
MIAERNPRNSDAWPTVIDGIGRADGAGRFPLVEIVTLCTGNAATSVTAGALLEEHVPGASITTSGTHVPG